MVHRGTFYFTFSCGSGAYRSHVGRLRFVDGKLKYADSGGFLYMDLFVSEAANGKVRVSSGKYLDFNRWEEGFGTVEEETALAVYVFGTSGIQAPFAHHFPEQQERDIDVADE